MKTKIKKLTAREIKVLCEKFETLKFTTDFDIVYEKQIPNTGIVVIEGQICLMKRKKEFLEVGPGNLLGLHNLIHDEPSKEGFKVLAPSELMMLHKSEILKALNDKDSELYAIIKDVS